MCVCACVWAGGEGQGLMERLGCIKVKEKCERGRQGSRGKLAEGVGAASARLNTVSQSSRAPGVLVGVTAVEIHSH